MVGLSLLVPRDGVCGRNYIGKAYFSRPKSVNGTASSSNCRLRRNIARIFLQMPNDICRSEQNWMKFGVCGMQYRAQNLAGVKWYSQFFKLSFWVQYSTQIIADAE